MAELSSLSFDQLLDVYFTRDGVEAELQRRYGRVGAVLVAALPTAGLRAHGVSDAAALARVAAARGAMAPALRVHEGIEVLAGITLFEGPVSALLAALDAQRALTTTVGGHTLRARIGLGFGPGLFVQGREAAGAEVDHARSLGRVARAGEILATDAFFRALGSLPAGVGAFRAPSEREAEAGFPFHVVGDYR